MNKKITCKSLFEFFHLDEPVRFPVFLTVDKVTCLKMKMQWDHTQEMFGTLSTVQDKYTNLSDQFINLEYRV